MGTVIRLHPVGGVRERQHIERLARQLEATDAYRATLATPTGDYATVKRLLITLFLLLPFAAFGANFSASLTTYDPHSTSWSLNCGINGSTKTLMGSAAVGSPIAFTAGSPGDDVACQAFTTKGVDTSPFSSEVIVHIPLVLTAPVLSVVLQP